MLKTGLPRDLAVALMLLTRLPLPRLPDAWFADQGRAAWAFPLAGLAVAAPAAALAWGAQALGAGAWVAAGLCLAVQVTLSGAMHEDGLADTADGLWGGADPARRLEIMRDSRIGTYGVIALILGLGLRWGALAALLGAGHFWAPVAAAMLSRGLMPSVMAALPSARRDGLARGVGAVSWPVAALALGLGVGAMALVAGSAAVPAVLAAALAVAGLARQARARIGGQTGDILGAVQQLAEIAALVAMQAALAP